MITALKLIVFIISMIGYVIYVDKKFKLQVEFVPIIVISLITVILFFGGLLNVLLLTSYALLYIGIYLFLKNVFRLYKENKLINTFNTFCTPGILLYAFLIFYFILILKNQRLTDYDNFSHWGLIVKNMLMDDSLPNFENATIMFSSYPPGTALFIYYFCRIVGVSEGLALIAQMLIILSGILSIFSFTSFLILSSKKKDEKLFKKIFMTLLTIFAAFYLLNGPSSIHDLLVDTTLNVVGIALFALVFFYKDSVEKVYTPVIFLVSFLTMIKNSGLFFVFIALLFFIFRFINNKEPSLNKKWRSNKRLLVLLASPGIVYYLWSRHVSMVFPDASSSKHSMSLNNYMNIYNQKSAGEISEISRKFISALWDGYGQQASIMMLSIVVLLIIYYLKNSVLDKVLFGIAMMVFTIFVLYNLGLWGMYLVSMPTSESLMLAGYSRYMNTLIDYMFAITIIGILNTLKTFESDKLFLSINVFILIYFGFTGMNTMGRYKEIFSRQELIDNNPGLIISKIDSGLHHLSSNAMSSKSNGAGYLVYYPEDTSIGFEQFYLKYRLYTTNIGILKNTDITWAFDCFVVTKIDENIKIIFEEYSDLLPEIGTYKFDKENKRIHSKIN